MSAARRALEPLAWVAALAAGVAAGVLGSFVHATGWGAVPVGQVAGLALTGSVVMLARLAGPGRTHSVLASAGWLAAVVVLSMPRPEGDLVVPATGAGYSWIVLGMLGCAAAVLSPSLPRGHRTPEPDPALPGRAPTASGSASGGR